MNECEPKGFTIHAGRVLLYSYAPLRGSNWPEFRRAVEHAGIKDLKEMFVASKKGWNRVVMLPPVSAKDVEGLVEVPEYKNVQRNPDVLYKVLENPKDSLLILKTS